MRRSRVVTAVVPDEVSLHDGLAYSLWLPTQAVALGAGLLLLHGAGSCKENQHDFARAGRAAGFAVLAFDQRGHGASEGVMGASALDDVASMAELLRARVGIPDAKLALRGSSMGGCLAILAADRARVGAVVAICPASTGGMRRLLAAEPLPFRADIPALDAMLAQADLHSAVGSLRAPMLLLHAEGDEQVPVQHSRELAQLARFPGSRLITLPGGHHRSIQHDEELQAVSLRFIERSLELGRRR